MAGGGWLLALGAGLWRGRLRRRLPAQAIRPPGALAEDDFLAACVRCGLCVRDCPYNTLKLARSEDPVATGTPYFTARDRFPARCARTSPASRPARPARSTAS
jgi:ferredoxin-type protein NapG